MNVQQHGVEAAVLLNQHGSREAYATATFTGDLSAFSVYRPHMMELEELAKLGREQWEREMRQPREPAPWVVSAAEYRRLMAAAYPKRKPVEPPPPGLNRHDRRAWMAKQRRAR